MLISAFSTVYVMKTRLSYPLLPIVFFFCLVLALWGVWHNYKWFVWASSQASVPLDWMLLSMENRGLLVSVPLTQCAETKGHDRCQDRGPRLLSSRPLALIHIGIYMSQCHLCEYMTFMNETLECYNITHHNVFIPIQELRFEDFNLRLFNALTLTKAKFIQPKVILWI